MKVNIILAFKNKIVPREGISQVLTNGLKHMIHNFVTNQHTEVRKKKKVR